MRKKSLTHLQSQIRSREREVNQMVSEFKETMDHELWNRLRSKVRTEDERRALDRACAERYQLLKKLGLFVYDKEKRVMTIAKLDIL